MKFRLFMACIMGIITPSINAKMSDNTTPLPVFEKPETEVMAYYKEYSSALFLKIKEDLKVLVEEHLT